MRSLVFKLPDEYDRQRLIAELAEDYPIAVDRSTSQRFSVYDTFDWRLYNDDLVLHRSGNELAQRSLVDGGVQQSVELQREVVFIWDLPPGELKEELTPIVDVRALIELAEAQMHSTPLRILNKDEKTVVRLAHEKIQISGGEGTPREMKYIRLIPVRGYPRYYRELTTRFYEAGFSVSNYRDTFDQLLRTADRTPGVYSSKLNLQLLPEMQANEALKIIMRFLLGVMRSNEPGIRADIDTEFLHDYRVAVRRTRSALSQVKGVFPVETADRFKRGFAALGQLTNPLRDLDVYLLKENEYKSMLPASLQGDLDPMFEYLRERRSGALQRVIKGLDSSAYSKMLAEWENFLNKPPKDDATFPNVGRPIVDLARERIYKRYRSIVKAGKKIPEGGDEEMMHVLRIECKKLRYLLEFFTSLFPSNKVESSIKQLRGLQDNLGDFNDYCVQGDYLLNIANELPATDTRFRKTLVAIGSLVERLEEEKQQVVVDFAETFSEFASPQNRAIFQELFAPRGETA